jgi:glyceraldehyde 3-phosphate dehydrogenase
MIRVAINGFGRIGRQAFKVWFDKHREEAQIVAVNDLCDATVLAHLLKYDSVYGVWNQNVKGVDNQIEIDGISVKVLSEKEPETSAEVAPQISEEKTTA